MAEKVLTRFLSSYSHLGNSYSLGRDTGEVLFISSRLPRGRMAGRAISNAPFSKRRGIEEDEKRKMIAHAWIRCGKAFVTGGNGTADGYAVVEKFRAGINR